MEVQRIKVDLILYYKVINNFIQIDTANSIRHKDCFGGYNSNFTLFIVKQKLENISGVTDSCLFGIV